MEIAFNKISLSKNVTSVFFLAENLKLPALLAKLDGNGGVIKKAIKSSGFSGKKGKFVSILGADGYDRIVLVGVGGGDDKIKSKLDLQNLGGNIYSYLDKERVKAAEFIIENDVSEYSSEEAAAHIAYGTKLKSYRFDKYFTKRKDDQKPALENLVFRVKKDAEANKNYETLEKIADGVFFTRNVVSEPPNVLYPESYAEICKKELSPLGVKVEILDVKQMKKLGMGSLLGVGQGSVRESRMVVMQWLGGKKSDKILGFVGKGVTFDTGGISIKPSQDMDAMKYDMAGSGAVVGLMRALAARKAKANVVGVIGLVENMPDGGAQRPGDIVKSMSGQTIEVLNTDAEGRLVLADALWYTQDRFKPEFMVNLATLTGAITIALGEQRAGLFSNDDKLSERLFKVGEKTGERLWRLPLGPEYDKQIDSKVADMQNIGNAKGAGSITAAQFLQRFVNGTPWAHLDIAGVAWTKKPLDIVPEGATGFGVRLLNKLVQEYYE